MGLDGFSVATLVHYHRPNFQAWALNAPAGCIPALFRGVQNNSITVIPDVVRVWSSPFLPTLMNSLTNSFSCSLLTCIVPDDFFMKRSCICQRHQPPCMRACCTSKEPRSVRQQQCAIRRNHNYRIIDHYNKTKAFIGAKEKAPRGSESGVAKSRRSNW